jgi:hypothetical protein
MVRYLSFKLWGWSVYAEWDRSSGLSYGLVTTRTRSGYAYQVGGIKIEIDLI